MYTDPLAQQSAEGVKGQMKYRLNSMEEHACLILSKDDTLDIKVLE